MKKYYISLISLFIILLITGCGHNVGHVDRGVGIKFRIPLPDGSALIDLTMGKIDSTTFILRGASDFDSVGATGGSLFGSAGTSDRVSFCSLPQLNQRNALNFLQNKSVEPQVKSDFIKYYLSVSHPPRSNVKAVSIGAAVGSGQDAQKTQPKSVGLDNVVDKTKEVIQNISDNTSNSVNNTAHSWKVTTDNITVISAIAACSFIIFLSFIIILILVIRKKGNKLRNVYIDYNVK